MAWLIACFISRTSDIRDRCKIVDFLIFTIGRGLGRWFRKSVGAFPCHVVSIHRFLHAWICLHIGGTRLLLNYAINVVVRVVTIRVIDLCCSMESCMISIDIGVLLLS